LLLSSQERCWLEARPGLQGLGEALTKVFIDINHGPT
jgi:hypothetical protein